MLRLIVRRRGKALLPEQAIVAELDMDSWTRAARVEAAERQSLITVLDAWKAAKAS